MININNIKININILSIIAEIEKFNGIWNTIEKTVKNRLTALKNNYNRKYRLFKSYRR